MTLLVAVIRRWRQELPSPIPFSQHSAIARHKSAVKRIP